jgi:hypothetical protein
MTVILINFGWHHKIRKSQRIGNSYTEKGENRPNDDDNTVRKEARRSDWIILIKKAKHMNEYSQIQVAPVAYVSIFT